jgi:hypothetical protein
MAVSLDRSTTSIVVSCSSCGFRAITLADAQTAAAIGIRHASVAHGDASQAIKLAAMIRSRLRAAS